MLDALIWIPVLGAALIGFLAWISSLVVPDSALLLKRNYADLDSSGGQFEPGNTGFYNSGASPGLNLRLDL